MANTEKCKVCGATVIKGTHFKPMPPANVEEILSVLLKEFGAHRHSAATTEETMKMYVGSDHYNGVVQALNKLIRQQRADAIKSYKKVLKLEAEMKAKNVK